MQEMGTGKTVKENIRDLNPLSKRELKSTVFCDERRHCSAEENSLSQTAT